MIAADAHRVPAPFRAFAVRSDEPAPRPGPRARRTAACTSSPPTSSTPRPAHASHGRLRGVDIDEPFSVDYAATTWASSPPRRRPRPRGRDRARPARHARVGGRPGRLRPQRRTRIDWLASRGAGFHNDVARHWSRSLFWILALDVGDVEFVLPHAGVRVALAEGDLVVFDQVMAHGLCRPADAGRAVAESFEDGDAGRQLFLTGEMLLDDAQWAALGAPWSPVEAHEARRAGPAGGRVRRPQRRHPARALARGRHVGAASAMSRKLPRAGALRRRSFLTARMPAHALFPCTAARLAHPATLAAVALTACASPPSTTPQPRPSRPTAAQAAGVSMDELAQQQGFARWVAGFEDGARAAGVDDATLHLAFDDAHYVRAPSAPTARSPSSRARRGTTSR